MPPTPTRSLLCVLVLSMAGCGAPAPAATEPTAEPAPPDCVVPADDAVVYFETAEVLTETLPDIDGDGQPDVAYFIDEGGNAQIAEMVYLTNHGCGQRAGEITSPGELTWDATRRELRGGWIDTPVGSCGPGDISNTAVFYRLEGTRLVEDRRVECPCEDGPPECQ
ncbi:MAG: hypothetical protein KC619_12690 [Myxococcales bacterium]|nr:hypothetical protein [Myxococcales bacterium]